MTLEAWVKPSTTSSTPRYAIAKTRSSGGFDYALAASDSGPATGMVRTASQYSTPAGSLTAGSWWHLAATYDGTDLRIYVDGVLASSRSVSGTIAASGGQLRIGTTFKGVIDDVRIWDGALAAPAIQADGALDGAVARGLFERPPAHEDALGRPGPRRPGTASDARRGDAPTLNRWSQEAGRFDRPAPRCSFTDLIPSRGLRHERPAAGVAFNSAYGPRSSCPRGAMHQSPRIPVHVIASARLGPRYAGVLLIAAAVVLAIILLRPAVATAACDRTASPRTLESKVDAAKPGQTICLKSGDYGTWAGHRQADHAPEGSRGRPTMKVSLGPGDSGFTLDGMSGMGGTVRPRRARLHDPQLDVHEPDRHRGDRRRILLDHNQLDWDADYDRRENAKIFVWNDRGVHPA